MRVVRLKIMNFRSIKSAELHFDGHCLIVGPNNVGKVFADNVDCGLRQIETGFAWHYVAYAKEQDKEDRLAYSTAESSARAASKGLWRDPEPVAPWDWRHNKASRSYGTIPY